MAKQVVFDSEKIAQLDKKYRISLVNSISGFKSANLIGSIDKKDHTNLAIFNSVMHIGANPPLLGFILRPITVPRHTYQNIKETGVYTINYINSEMIDRAHQTGAKYEKEESEFVECGFEERYYKDFEAPFVAESNIKLGMQFKEELPIESNGTRLIVGEIKHIIVEDEVFLRESGAIDLIASNATAIAGLDTYFAPHFIKKLPIPRR